MDEEDAAKELGVDMAADVVTCEVPFGSVLFLNNIIPHRRAAGCFSCACMPPVTHASAEPWVHAGQDAVRSAPPLHAKLRAQACMCSPLPRRKSPNSCRFQLCMAAHCGLQCWHLLQPPQPMLC